MYPVYPHFTIVDIDDNLSESTQNDTNQLFVVSTTTNSAISILSMGMCI